VSLLLLLASLTQGAALPPERWTCTADLSTGFVFDAPAQRWRQANFRPSPPFAIAPVARSDLPGGWEWTAVGSSGNLFDAGGCGATFSADVYLHCRAPTWNLRFNRVSGRFVRSHDFGYFNVAPGLNGITDEQSDTPLIEIGTCRRTDFD
jgi:hypothetical protein